MTSFGTNFRVCVLLMGIALFVLPYGETYGQMRVGRELPRALEAIPPAAGMCRREEAVALLDRADAKKAVVPILDCGISIDEAQKVMANPSTQLVDLRTSVDFRVFHIEGALNLSMTELLTKPYWRDKSVVLLGDGKGEVELYRACSRLKQRGYRQVRVLRGGMSMWLAQEQPVTGSAPASVQLAQLSPSELWAESQSTENLLVVDPGLRGMLADLPGAVGLVRSDVVAIQTAMEKRRKGSSNVAIASLIWITDATPEQILQVRQAVGVLPLLVYTQGREPLRQQISLQQAVWAAQARGPKQLGCGL